MRKFLYIITLPMFFATISFASDSLTADLVESKTSSKTISQIAESKKMIEFLKSSGDSGLLGAIASAQGDYESAIQKLADVMTSCRSKSFDESWRVRAESKFGKSRLAQVEKDLKLIIGARYFSQLINCEKEEVKTAFYTEANLLPLLFEFGDELRGFLKTAKGNDLKFGKAAFDYIETLRSAKPTPLQLLVNPSAQLKSIAKAKLVEKDVADFVNTDSSFSGAFNLSAAIKSVKF